MLFCFRWCADKAVPGGVLPGPGGLPRLPQPRRLDRHGTQVKHDRISKCLIMRTVFSDRQYLICSGRTSIFFFPTPLSSFSCTVIHSLVKVCDIYRLRLPFARTYVWPSSVFTLPRWAPIAPWSTCLSYILFQTFSWWAAVCESVGGQQGGESLRA